MKKKKQSPVFMAGEPELVIEFGTVCHRAGFMVTIKPERSVPRAKYPAILKQSPSLPRGALFAVELTNTNTETKKRNLQTIDRALPPGTPLLSSSVTTTLAEQARWIRRPSRLVGLSAFPTLLNQRLMELSTISVTDRAVLSRVADIAIALGKELVVVQDSIGMVMPRILAMIINESAFALTEQLASAEDIDTAMKLGTNYPSGPIELLGKVGIRQVTALLEALHAEFGDDRYRLAPLLRQMDRSS